MLRSLPFFTLVICAFVAPVSNTFAHGGQPQDVVPGTAYFSLNYNSAGRQHDNYGYRPGLRSSPYQYEFRQRYRPNYGQRYRRNSDRSYHRGQRGNFGRHGYGYGGSSSQFNYRRH